MGYVYRGTIRDVEETPAPVKPRPNRFNPAKCGTYAGYQQHRHFGVLPICPACMAAQTAYTREYMKRRGGRTAPPLKGRSVEVQG